MAENKELLVPINEYLKAGIHIGTKFKTKDMEPFIYKMRQDGLHILNLQKIDERIAMAAKVMAQFNPEEILVVSRRENGWQAVKLFNKATGIRVITGRYSPGMLTNTQLKTFTEIKLLIVTDAWPDRNAVLDSMKSGAAIIGLCDTNNMCNNLDLVVPCNNKGKKSLGILFYVLAREYLKAKGLLTAGQDISVPLEKFMEE